MQQDPLAWLLPDVGEPERGRVRRLVTALRLVRDDARACRSQSIAPGRERAQRELERLERRRSLRALDGLLHAYLEAELARDSFLDLGTPALGYEESWRVLLGTDGALRRALPAPGANPFEVVERLLEVGRLGGAPRTWRGLWSARRLHVEAGAERGEARWDELFRRSRANGERLVFQAACLAGRVAARLDRFDPRGARELFRGHEALAGVDPHLGRLLAWSALACGERESARELFAALAVHGARLPLPMLELSTALEEPLPGRAPERGREPQPRRVASRREFGAVLLAVYAFGPRGEPENLLLDAATAVRAVSRRAERYGAWRRPGEPEHELCAGAALVRRHRSSADGGPGLRGALAGPRSRALALAAIRAPDGRTLGWLHVESEHHLLPSSTRLRAAAGAWRDELLPRARCEPARAGSVTGALPAIDDPRLEFFAHLLAAIGRRLARRRLYLVEVVAGGALLVRAEHGGALSDWRARAGGAGAPWRAVARASPVVFAEPDAALGLHAGAGSGVALPLASAGPRAAIDGLVVLESCRPRDLLAADVEALQSSVRSLLPVWRAALFRAWHGERFGADLAWDPQSRFVSSLESTLSGLARPAREPLVLAGPDGAGRRTLARALHFLGERREAPLVEGLGAVPGPGTRVLDLLALSHAAQRELAETLARGVEERLLLLSPLAPDAARERGLLVRELERRVDPLPLEVPRLADRRDEIPALVRALARNLCRNEARPTPTFADDALADLWRQGWRGQVRELASVVAQLVRSGAGGVLTGAEVRAGFRALRLSFRERLPSLRPRSLDLALALRITRHKSGAWNRSRAARYLGWDPDTLEARLDERRGELGDESPGP